MAVFSIRQNISLLVNILLLLILAVFLLQPLSWDKALPDEFWIRQAFLFFLWLGLYYVTSRILVPQLLFKNKIGWFVILLLGSIIGVVILSRLFEAWINLPELMERAFNSGKTKRSGSSKSHYFDMLVLLTTMLVAGIATSITAVKMWQKDAQIRHSLEQEKTASELSFLRAQINPHFFFNTLHSIYALTVANVELAREALYTLSQMMRYVLYETQHGTTSLSKEISFINNYIQLMQLRLTDKVNVIFESPDPVNDLQIAPMLLLPFVENAFKHGVSTVHPGNIYIIIKQQGKTLEVEVRNSILNHKGSIFEENNGIGLTNTRRRLNLLYPGRYTLHAGENTSDMEFLVQLKIDLS